MSEETTNYQSSENTEKLAESQSNHNQSQYPYSVKSVVGIVFGILGAVTGCIIALIFIYLYYQHSLSAFSIIGYSGVVLSGFSGIIALILGISAGSHIRNTNQRRNAIILGILSLIFAAFSLICAVIPV